jgi:tRNA (guanine-N7-)-methyltransferase
MAKILAAIAGQNLANIRLHFGDAADLLAWLPSGGLSGLDLLYPDPWPKRRHWKRRFVQAHRITEFARVLRPGGTFRFATDIPDYAAWTLDLFLRSNAFEWTAERADDWRCAWDGYRQTRYEAKALRAGRMPCYLIFRRL